MTDADAECSETIVWIDFSLDCKYVSENKHDHFADKYQEVGRMLGTMIKNPKKFEAR